MDAVSVVFTVVLYLACLIFVVGLVRKVRQYALTPAPLKIALTPAPTTRAGVGVVFFREAVFFASLFRSNKWTWLLGWSFHVALLLIVLRHLRYFLEPVWTPIVLIQPFGTYAGFVMVLGLLGLWARRFLVDRVRFISTPSDHLMLVLLLAIALTGLGMRFVIHTDIIGVKIFIQGLMALAPQSLPADPVLWVHLGLVALLMMIFPISKLLHAPGMFFSPTRHMVDNPREARHIASWVNRLDQSAQ
jgi:nitrate reductase gamma subunit